MHTYNLIIIGFIIAAFFLLLWWSFNTVRRIDLQKNFCAISLTSIAKLWRRANFVPEDAKERESLYLYRDFLQKFNESECKYPIMVKNGGVRCMTRKEYDDLCGQKNFAPISILITMLSAFIAINAIAINIMITKTIFVGIGLACILPVLQFFMALFIARFNKDKNNYRNGIFMALKENSVAFLSITKPFIIIDAYPEIFGKEKKSLYTTIGTLTEEQITATRDFVIRQKEAETKVVLNNVNNDIEIKRLTEQTNTKPAPVVTDNETQNTMAENTTKESATQLTNSEKINLIQKLVDDNLETEIKRAVEQAEQANQAEQETATVENLAPLPTDVPLDTDVVAPAEDDFSLDAIGQALDAEIAKRHNKK
ncbi:MAG: hypothetical protein J5598_01525 [Clostridia bacterium]|nr:hypothetical protein [Clostridia bacterium]